MKKIWNWFLYILILAGFPLLVWASYTGFVDTYKFWKYGIEEQARVIALDYISYTRGGNTYYYQIQIQDQRSIQGFSYRLPVGKSVKVLVMPDNPKKITLGNRDSGLFEIFSYSMGGNVSAILFLIMLVFMIYGGPNTLIYLIKNRHKILNQ